LGEIGQIQAQPHHIVQRPASGFDHGFEVVERAPGLGLDAASDDFARGRIQRNLPGQKHHLAVFDGLRVGADGGGGTVGVDDLT